MKINVILICFCLFFSSSVMALSPAVIGGVRGGVALGMMADEEVGTRVGLRFGAEACTGKKPLILFFGGKFYLTNISGRYPLSFGLGLVVYSGGDGNADFGPSVSLIFDRPFDINRLFFEAGIDVADSGKLQLQAGYKL
ncbi:hypothetical protein A3K48_03655 [candidate division WOR-1 bacterium RIFOXYA12_FULL_52_29]|uniref:Outer membrane protein beta-barrel domain-containing protein n=1 Tax=candidate division WOR-1 bacterium RIFOXYC12_FULL_54_18 TaxID=1802584 RepID=A0A1F4T5R6_UNCSA|nr:MAG: hypothetical protein A3K44_03655 [candidate division WOR-1 bacterium RIFOXYA2_FULL_51_19]OGC17657.1 MAG: hypothetical protein A3K48_03655 [candidate division WOR-1 bacterium RIFOXYA12_FULL_52_29]OGC28074.1 MAG: hypothetical protein A3K49_03655 [candidate division WOR-1 bacterium RIFOXYC12_FULL_54_18]OGC29640.1 MAG: hypothetical protein A2346_02680 [candidate division WOR-1 bacterium RIFOXYB12_FULL_52_16]